MYLEPTTVHLFEVSQTQVLELTSTCTCMLRGLCIQRMNCLMALAFLGFKAVVDLFKLHCEMSHNDHRVT